MKKYSWLLTLIFLAACSVVQAQTESINRVIGGDDFLLVKSGGANIPPQFRPLMNAIGKLSSGCTATHIGQGFVVTAGHCFWQTFFDGELKQNEACSDEKIIWNWTADGIDPQSSNCKKIIAMQRDEKTNIDFAIIKIDKPPLAKIDIEWDKKPRAGSFVTIFSYPEESPLSWSRYCRIKKLKPADVFPTQMHHVCDTKTGSSGAAVIDMVSGKIWALHRSGDGEILEDGSLTPATENYAMYITQSPMRNLLIKSGYVIK